MFFQDNIKNIALILLVIVIFSGIGFYSAYIIQDDKRAQMAKEKDSTINRLNNEISYLRNIYGDLVIEYEELEKEMKEYENDVMQINTEYTELSEKHTKLDDQYKALLQDYADLNSSIELEREAMLTKTRVGENRVKVLFSNGSFECPQDALVSVNAFDDLNITDMLTYFPFTEKTVVALRWNHTEDEPEINTTLIEAYRFIGKYVDATGLNDTLIEESYMVRYTNFTAIIGGKERHVLLSTWYNADTSYHYICMVQQEENTALTTFSDIMASFEPY